MIIDLTATRIQKRLREVWRLADLAAAAGDQVKMKELSEEARELIAAWKESGR